MGFIAPTIAWIAAGVTVPLLVSLYFLKLRRREVTISSTLLWRKAIQDLQVNAPFQKLRRNLLLLLQLLALIGLLLALARPTLRGTAEAGERVVIVVDHSASMNATDANPTRLDQAKRLALELIDNLGSDTQPRRGSNGAMVISFAHRARVVQPFTTDLALLRQAVRSIQATDQASRLQSALQLIEPYTTKRPQQSDSPPSGGDPGGELIVYVLTDGRVTNDDRVMSLQGAELRPVIVGQHHNNLAVVSLSARRDFKKPRRVQALARLANYTSEPVSTNLTLKLDNQVQSVSSVRVPAAGDQPGIKSIQFDLNLPGTGLLEVRHDQHDDLATDDAAWLVLAPPKRLRVLLVTEGNAFLHRVVESAGVRKLAVMTPGRYEDQSPQYLQRRKVGSEELGFDLIIFDGYAPKEVPVVDSLYFAVAPPIQGMQLVGWRKPAAETQVILDWKRDHPLLRYVALDDVLTVQPGRLVLPDEAEILATSQTGPVIVLLTDQGVHHVVVGFDLLKSNWPLQISFPVWVSNAVRWLSLGGQAQAGFCYRPGDVATIPAGPGVASLQYEGPATLAPVAPEAVVGSNRAVLPMFEHVGVYQSNQDTPQPWDRLAVSLTDPAESDLRPADRLNVGTSVITAEAGSAMIRREVWPWFAAAALVMLMIEWVVYTRRMHL